MRKVIVFILVSLDGFFEGPNHEIDWHNVDSGFNDFAINQLNEIGTLLFGRVTYTLMASYWPTAAARSDDPVVAEKMNTLPKIVFSRTLKNVEWQNTRQVKEGYVHEIAMLKRESGKDLFIFGSSDLTVTLIKEGLIDEYRIMVNPVVLGEGKHLFQGLENRLSLKLMKTKVFTSGNVLLYYEPVRK